MLEVKQSVKQIGQIVKQSLAGAHRSRTYRRHRRVPTNGFEVRGVHRGPSAPIYLLRL